MSKSFIRNCTKNGGGVFWYAISKFLDCEIRYALLNTRYKIMLRPFEKTSLKLLAIHQCDSRKSVLTQVDRPLFLQLIVLDAHIQL